VHRVVAIGHHSLAETAGVDAEDQIDRLVEIGGAAQVVPHDDGHPLAADRDRLAAASLNEKSHFAACGDIFLTHVAQHFAILDQRRSADGAFARQDRESHDGRDTVAARCYFDQCILAQFEEGGFTQQVESRGSAHGLFGKNDQVGTLRFRFVDRIDDFRGIAVDIPDRIVQLGKGYFHLSVILVGKLQRRKVKDYL